MGHHPNQQVSLQCPACKCTYPVRQSTLGLETSCLQCNFRFLARSQQLSKLALYNETLGANNEKLFRGQLMFHKPARDGSTPSAEDPVLKLDPQIEVSYDLDEIREPRSDLHVVLDDIRSQWNVGSIFRTADAAGWSSVTLAGITSSPPSSGVMKTSLGATEFVPWRYRASCKQTLEEECARDDTAVVALELTPQSENVFNFVLPARRIVLVVGNEVSGVSPEALSICKHRLFIPMVCFPVRCVDVHN